MKDGLTSLNGEPILDENQNGKPVTLYFLATEDYYGFFGPMSYPTYWTKALVVWFEDRVTKGKSKAKVCSLWLRGDSRTNLIKHMQSASYRDIVIPRSLTVLKYGLMEKKLSNGSQVKVRPGIFEYKSPNEAEINTIKEILAEIPERRDELEKLLKFNSDNDLVILDGKNNSRVINEYNQKNALLNSENNGNYELPKLPQTIATLDANF